MSKRKKDTSIHHIKPTSRGGVDKNNCVGIPKSIHEAWHTIFENMTNDEAHQFIDMLMIPNKIWTRKEIHELRQSLKR